MAAPGFFTSMDTDATAEKHIDFHNLVRQWEHMQQQKRIGGRRVD
jgi:hypothetical protein